jgi:hypothetical protein
MKRGKTKNRTWDKAIKRLLAASSAELPVGFNSTVFVEHATDDGTKLAAWTTTDPGEADLPPFADVSDLARCLAGRRDNPTGAWRSWRCALMVDTLKDIRAAVAERDEDDEDDEDIEDTADEAEAEAVPMSVEEAEALVASAAQDVPLPSDPYARVAVCADPVVRAAAEAWLDAYAPGTFALTTPDRQHALGLLIRGWAGGASDAVRIPTRAEAADMVFRLTRGIHAAYAVLAEAGLLPGEETEA